MNQFRTEEDRDLLQQKKDPFKSLRELISKNNFWLNKQIQSLSESLDTKNEYLQMKLQSLNSYIFGECDIKDKNVNIKNITSELVLLKEQMQTMKEQMQTINMNIKMIQNTHLSFLAIIVVMIAVFAVYFGYHSCADS